MYRISFSKTNWFLYQQPIKTHHLQNTLTPPFPHLLGFEMLSGNSFEAYCTGFVLNTSLERRRNVRLSLIPRVDLASASPKFFCNCIWRGNLSRMEMILSGHSSRFATLVPDNDVAYNWSHHSHWHVATFEKRFRKMFSLFSEFYTKKDKQKKKKW